MLAGDRVSLATDPSWLGRIEKIKGDVADVVFDGDGKGRINMSDLRKEGEEPDEDQDERERARQQDDKSWPPRNIEQKVPNPGGTK